MVTFKELHQKVLEKDEDYCLLYQFLSELALSPEWTERQLEDIFEEIRTLALKRLTERMTTEEFRKFLKAVFNNHDG